MSEAPDWIERLGLAGVVRALAPAQPAKVEDATVGGPVPADAGRGLRPVVVDKRGIRRLYFDGRFIQSAMRLDDPFALQLSYTRMMMAFLLFVPDPTDILLIGLGGGSLAKFCHRHLPDTRITVVEINDEVIALRDQFEVPNDERLVIVHADALDFLPACNDQFDAILLDGFDADGIAPSFSNPGFYQAAASRLRPAGVLASNLIGEQHRWLNHLRLMWEAFGRKVRIIGLPGEGDHYIALAFHDPLLYRLPAYLDRTARELKARIPLDFIRLVHWVRRADIPADDDEF